MAPQTKRETGHVQFRVLEKTILAKILCNFPEVQRLASQSDSAFWGLPKPLPRMIRITDLWIQELNCSGGMTREEAG
jgi:hypothetical protein